jgi:hypothetical protein
VHRIWRAFGLQPRRVETFKLSSDPLSVEKFRDIVGLYLAPPERAVGEQGEEAFDLVDPRCRRRGEVHMPAGPFREPVTDELGFVRSVVVHDDVNVEVLKWTPSAGPLGGCS